MADCQHLDVFESTVTTREGSFTSGFCWDCAANWRTQRLTTSRRFAEPREPGKVPVDPDAEQLAAQVGDLAEELARGVA